MLKKLIRLWMFNEAVAMSDIQVANQKIAKFNNSFKGLREFNDTYEGL